MHDTVTVQTQQFENYLMLKNIKHIAKKHGPLKFSYKSQQGHLQLEHIPSAHLLRFLKSHTLLKKSIRLRYTRGITPSVTSGGVHLRDQREGNKAPKKRRSGGEPLATLCTIRPVR